MNSLLKMKPWQLFIISFILPWILSFLYLFFVDLETFEAGQKLMGAISLMYYSVFLTWNYAVVKSFNTNSDALTKKQLKRFDWLLLIIIVYIVYSITNIELKFPDFVIFSILIWFLVITASFGLGYVIFCTAKTLKYFQLKDQLRTSDIIVEMFVIFYFPIGVWWLQKKVNKYNNEIKARTANKL